MTTWCSRRCAPVPAAPAQKHQPRELLRAVRAVSNGEAIFGPAIARRMVEYFARPRAFVTKPLFPDLTERERDVLDLIAAGHNNELIAEQLVLSVKTVRNYVSNIMSKLQVPDRAQAIVRARQAGFGETKPEVSQ